jgi:Lipocalin-like domain
MILRIKKFGGIVVLGMIFFLGSCQKEKTKTELLTGKTWKVSSIIVAPGFPNPNGGSPITEMLTQMPACFKDDLWKYSNDKKYVIDEGASKCDPTDPQISETGTWAFNSTETLLTMTSTTTVTEFTLLELSATTLKMSPVELMTHNGVNYAFTYTFAGQ